MTRPETLPCPECGAPPKTPHPSTCRTQAERVAYFAELVTQERARRKAQRIRFVTPCWACDAGDGQRHRHWCPDLSRDQGGTYRGTNETKRETDDDN